MSTFQVLFAIFVTLASAFPSGSGSGSGSGSPTNTPTPTVSPTATPTPAPAPCYFGDCTGGYLNGSTCVADGREAPDGHDCDDECDNGINGIFKSDGECQSGSCVHEDQETCNGGGGCNHGSCNPTSGCSTLSGYVCDGDNSDPFLDRTRVFECLTGETGGERCRGPNGHSALYNHPEWARDGVNLIGGGKCIRRWPSWVGFAFTRAHCRQGNSIYPPENVTCTHGQNHCGPNGFCDDHARSSGMVLDDPSETSGVSYCRKFCETDTDCGSGGRCAEAGYWMSSGGHCDGCGECGNEPDECPRYTARHVTLEDWPWAPASYVSQLDPEWAHGWIGTIYGNGLPTSNTRTYGTGANEFASGYYPEESATEGLVCWNNDPDHWAFDISNHVDPGTGGGHGVILFYGSENLNGAQVECLTGDPCHDRAGSGGDAGSACASQGIPWACWSYDAVVISSKRQGEAVDPYWAVNHHAQSCRERYHLASYAPGLGNKCDGWNGVSLHGLTVATLFDSGTGLINSAAVDGWLGYPDTEYSLVVATLEHLSGNNYKAYVRGSGNEFTDDSSGDADGLGTENIVPSFWAEEISDLGTLVASSITEVSSTLLTFELTLPGAASLPHFGEHLCCAGGPTDCDDQSVSVPNCGEFAGEVRPVIGDPHNVKDGLPYLLGDPDFDLGMESEWHCVARRSSVLRNVFDFSYASYNTRDCLNDRAVYRVQRNPHFAGDEAGYDHSEFEWTDTWYPALKYSRDLDNDNSPDGHPITGYTGWNRDDGHADSLDYDGEGDDSATLGSEPAQVGPFQALDSWNDGTCDLGEAFYPPYDDDAVPPPTAAALAADVGVKINPDCAALFVGTGCCEGTDCVESDPNDLHWDEDDEEYDVQCGSKRDGVQYTRRYGSIHHNWPSHHLPDPEPHYLRRYFTMRSNSTDFKRHPHEWSPYKRAPYGLLHPLRYSLFNDGHRDIISSAEAVRLMMRRNRERTERLAASMRAFHEGKRRWHSVRQEAVEFSADSPLQAWHNTAYDWPYIYVAYDLGMQIDGMANNGQNLVPAGVPRSIVGGTGVTPEGECVYDSSLGGGTAATELDCWIAKWTWRAANDPFCPTTYIEFNCDGGDCNVIVNGYDVARQFMFDNGCSGGDTANHCLVPVACATFFEETRGAEHRVVKHVASLGDRPKFTKEELIAQTNAFKEKQRAKRTEDPPCTIVGGVPDWDTCTNPSTSQLPDAVSCPIGSTCEAILDELELPEGAGGPSPSSSYFKHHTVFIHGSRSNDAVMVGKWRWLGHAGLASACNWYDPNTHNSADVDECGSKLGWHLETGDVVSGEINYRSPLAFAIAFWDNPDFATEHVAAYVSTGADADTYPAENWPGNADIEVVTCNSGSWSGVPGDRDVAFYDGWSEETTAYYGTTLAWWSDEGCVRDVCDPASTCDPQPPQPWDELGTPALRAAHGDRVLEYVVGKTNGNRMNTRKAFFFKGTFASTEYEYPDGYSFFSFLPLETCPGSEEKCFDVFAADTFTGAYGQRIQPWGDFLRTVPCSGYYMHCGVWRDYGADPGTDNYGDPNVCAPTDVDDLCERSAAIKYWDESPNMLV